MARLLVIRFHGRGGQGTVVATIMLAKAFFQAGYQVQTFPFFGVERRGAPVEAYVRVDSEKILLRTNGSTPDHVVVQDPTLLAEPRQHAGGPGDIRPEDLDGQSARQALVEHLVDVQEALGSEPRPPELGRQPRRSGRPPRCGAVL